MELLTDLISILYNKVRNAVKIPVIACSGAGHIRDIKECFNKTTVEAVAVGNFFHFTENAYPRTKKYLSIHRKDIRLDRMSNTLPKISWCSRCVYPSSSAVTLTFNEDYICSGCITS